MTDLPLTGVASTYENKLNGQPTASTETYRHELFTAAIMPKARWRTFPMRTRVEVSYAGRTVVVSVNDKGGGDGTMRRVLDLSRAAYAHLKGVRVDQVNDTNAGLITLTSIRIVDRATPLGPVTR